MAEQKSKPSKKSAEPKKSASKKAVAEIKSHAISVFDLKGKAIDSVTLDAVFLQAPLRTGVVYQAVKMYQAGEREGTACTKERGAVRGGGKKPWKQKGTGQARHGSRRSPIWRGGGVTHGPMPRSYGYTLPQTIRRQAVVQTVREKADSGKLLLLNELKIDSPKTKVLVGILEALKVRKPLIVVDQRNENLRAASRNIPTLAVKTAGEVNALDVAASQECVMTKAAYKGLIERLKS